MNYRINWQYIDRNEKTLSFNATTRQWTDTMGRVIGMLLYPGQWGTYTFHFQAIINTTPCNMQPDHTNEATITLYAGANDDAVNKTSCPNDGVGEPINFTNGNRLCLKSRQRSDLSFTPGFRDCVIEK